MKLFADASALVSIAAEETQYLELADSLLAANQSLWSAMSRWETVSALRRSYGFAIDEARAEVERMRLLFTFEMVAIGDQELVVALDAYTLYGKGRHAAKLNMGDCFAYACAKTNHARLLYKGDDFARTDLR